MNQKAPLELQSISFDQNENQDGRRTEGIFLTDIGIRKQNSTKRRNFSSRAHMSTRKSARNPSEKIISHERVTFIHQPAPLEENKSFNLVK